mgnify:FL=1
MKIAFNPDGPPAAVRGKTQTDQLESAFLAEMLKYTGVDASGSFSGGIGESQFASWLTEQRADALSRRIDLKFAESLVAR